MVVGGASEYAGSSSRMGGVYALEPGPCGGGETTENKFTKIFNLAQNFTGPENGTKA